MVLHLQIIQSVSRSVARECPMVLCQEAPKGYQGAKKSVMDKFRIVLIVYICDVAL